MLRVVSGCFVVCGRDCGSCVQRPGPAVTIPSRDRVDGPSQSEWPRHGGWTHIIEFPNISGQFRVDVSASWLGIRVANSVPPSNESLQSRCAGFANLAQVLLDTQSCRPRLPRPCAIAKGIRLACFVLIAECVCCLDVAAATQMKVGSSW